MVQTRTVEVNFCSILPDEGQEVFTVNAFTKSSINVGRDFIDVSALKSKYPHLDPVPGTQIDYSSMSMILGQDAYEAIRPIEYFVSSTDKSSPVAVRLPLGWVLSGPLPSTSNLSSSCFEASSEEDSTLAREVKLWYDMETFGAVKNLDPSSAEESRAKEILHSTTFHDGKKYVVGMLWREPDIELPNNYYAALAQLKSLENRLGKDADLRERYAQTIKDDLEKGYVETVEPSESQKRSKREWYLPHHPVLKPNKPGKVRRVLNGAALFHKQSLNSAWMAGPDLLQNLLYIILNFRQHRYAVSADIEGMFLQLGVPNKDQTSLRFLWREDPTQKVVVHQYTRHIFGAKDSPSCANYALQRTADVNCKEFRRAAGSVWNNFYMDDYLESFATSEEATERCQDLVTLLKRGGFKLKKFVSNFNLPPSLPPLQDQSPGTPEVCELSSHVLGLKWNQRSDTLVVSRGVNRSVTEPVTQRLVLSRVASIFDPIGIVAPYTIKARLMLKEVWRLHGQQWDEVLSEELTEEFLHWSKALPELSTLELQRCYFSEHLDSLELHVFGDSSKEVFGAVAFLRARQKSDGSTQLAFVIGKEHNAPMKSLTIPKLELQAALLAFRLKRHVEAALTLAIEKPYMWSDSSTVPQWLHSPEKQPVFVSNRISEILDASTVDEWAHVFSTNNPADVVTKGMSIDELKSSSWINGPEFLRTEDWPFQPPTQRVPVKSPKLIQDPPVAQQTTMSSASKCVDPFIVWTNYSSYAKLVRTVAYMLRVNPKFRDSVKTSTIDPGEFRRAEANLLLLAQSEMFPKEQKALAKREYVASNSIKAAFVPFVGQVD